MAQDSTDLYLLTVDSLRADYVTPDLFSRSWERLSSDFLQFERAYANGIATPLSFPSILADDLVSGDGTVDPDATRLAELFDGPTVGYPNNVHLSRERGYHRGFSTYDPGYDLRELLAGVARRSSFRSQVRKELRRRLPYASDPRVPIPYTPADSVSAKLKGILRTDAPVFLWGHFMDPHGPYYPSLVFDRAVPTESTLAELESYNDDWSNNRPIAEPGLSEMVALYEAKIEYLDRHLATFLDWLTETGRYDDAMIVVTADHGQFVGEETRFGHDWGFFPEDPLVRVPLFVKFPGDREGDRVSHPVQHRDIVATVARAFDVDAETDPATSPLTDAEGRSILTKSNAAVRGVHADGEVAKCAAGELDIEGDPPERLVEAVRSEDLARVGVDVGQAQMSADERESVDERLEQLGYK
jgi:hypothetical protein